MRILLDEDVHIKVRHWLIQEGHDVLRVPLGLKNGNVLALARQESRILISRDKDFTNRLQYPPTKHFGIIVLRIHPPSYDRLTAALKALFNQVAEAEYLNTLTVVEPEGFHQFRA